MKKKIAFPHRLKQDGSDDTMCLSCFKTISREEFEAGKPATSVDEHDHICAFAFPDRRANEVTFEDGPKRRRSDMEWQMLISREAFVSGD
jgi:hypothetical protein